MKDLLSEDELRRMIRCLSVRGLITDTERFKAMKRLLLYAARNPTKPMSRDAVDEHEWIGAK